MGEQRLSAVRRVTLMFTAWSLVVASVAVLVDPAAVTAQLEGEEPEWVQGIDGFDGSEREAVPWEESASAEQVEVQPSDPLPEPAYPDGGSWQVELGGPGEQAATLPTQDEGPVAITSSAGDGGALGAATERAGEVLELEVHGRTAAERLGVTGFVFRVGEVASAGASPVGVLSEAAGQDEAVPVEMAVDYAGFAAAHGAGFADRLQVVALPDCVLEDPRPAGCDTAGRSVPSRNDLTSQQLVVDVEDLAGLAVDGVPEVPSEPVGEAPEPSGVQAGSTAEAETSGDGAVVFAVTSGLSGEEGSFAATPLGVTGSWQVGGGSGEFTYSHDVELPKPPGGEAPSVGLTYSSAAVDGMTTGTNAQAGQNGLGWSGFAGAFIERRYAPCRNVGIELDELCWDTWNATLSMGGVSGALLPIDGSYNEWKVESDPGWKVERLTGANNGVAQNGSDHGRPGGFETEGEHWKVTAPDGTRYFFGLGRTPDGGGTASAWRVPVWAGYSGEPCRWDDDALGVCDQAWRWNLDRVVDPNGNITSYTYDRETNQYNMLGGPIGQDRTYDRSGQLAAINYGWRQGGQPAARVVFGSDARCVHLDASCEDPDRWHGLAYPDVPTDLICGGDDDNDGGDETPSDNDCPVPMPSFFSGRRYTHVQTELRLDGAWDVVDVHNIFHVFDGPGENVGPDYKLQMSHIQHVGLRRDQLEVRPPMTFDRVLLPNRVDVDEEWGKGPMEHHRISRVTNEAGGVTEVTYGQPNPCPPSYWPQRWDTNVTDCFPVSVVDRWLGQDISRKGVFNKYLVTSIDEDPGAGGSMATTTYDYEGEPAWAFNYGIFAQDDIRWAWTAWRGYGTVSVTEGLSTTRTRMFRGMDADPTLAQVGGTWCPCEERDVDVETFDGSQTFADHRALAGATLEEQQIGTIDGVSDVPLHSALREYEHRVTGSSVSPELRDPQWVGLVQTTETVATSPTEARQRRSTMSYNDHYQVVTTAEEGWLDVTGDERCAATTYAENPNLWMFTYPATSTSYAGECGTGQELAASEVLYDGTTTAGAPPTAGNATTERTKLDGGNWAETSTAYDSRGRVVSTTDANGATTTTVHMPTDETPATTTVTNELGHTTEITWSRLSQQPRRTVDPNGNMTQPRYDGFGRLTNVRLPTEQPGSPGKEPSWRFSYSADGRVIRSRQLTSEATSGSDVHWEDSWVIYDGFMRQRQAQTLSPASGKVIVAETTYDGRGLTRNETVAQAVTADPGAYIPDITWDNHTRHLYDEIGRKTRTEWRRQGTGVVHETTYAYTEDTTTVTPPEGGQTREVTDGLGRTVAVEEHNGTEWQSSTYDYDLADNLVSVSDPQGNQIDYTYNMAGWRLTRDDPNRGTASYTYDPAGNKISVTDAAGQQVHTLYDPLGRPTERRAGSPTGALLASWDYDATGQLGLLSQRTRHTPDGDWVTTMDSYDGRKRLVGTTTTVPAGIPGLSGSYSIGYTYDRANRVTSVSYPAVGGLPAETVTTNYDSLGQADSMSGLSTYVNAVNHDDRGRPVTTSVGPDQGFGWMLKFREYDADQRLSVTDTAIIQGDAYQSIGRHELTYTDGGNLAQRTTNLDGQEWRECYDYDQRQRLVGAHTVATSETCADGTPGGGPQPYEHTYTYSPDGNLLERSTDSQTTTYDYPGSGQPRPHAPTAVDGDTYTWDANGNLVERQVDGGTETFSWDIEQKLNSVTNPDGTTSFVYDVDGQRLLRETDDGATLYITGHEVHATGDGSTESAVRSYTFNGELIATRAPDGVSYMAGNEAGSIEVQADTTSGVTATRAYHPYGQARAENGSMVTQRGFLGQIEDPITDLSYLNARYYDANVGIFLSSDPLYDTAKPKTLNPYSYAGGNPTTYADPSGLSAKATIKKLHSGLRYWRGQAKIWEKRANYWYGEAQQSRRTASKLRGVIAYQRKTIHHFKVLTKNMHWTIKIQQGVISHQQRIIWKQQLTIRHQRATIGNLEWSLAQAWKTIAAKNQTISKLNERVEGLKRTVSSQANAIDALQVKATNNDEETIASLRRHNASLRSMLADMVALAFVQSHAISDLQEYINSPTTYDWVPWIFGGDPIIGTVIWSYEGNRMFRTSDSGLLNAVGCYGSAAGIWINILDLEDDNC